MNPDPSGQKGKRLRVCVVTGTRADYGLLRPIMLALKADPAFELMIVASAMHLVPEFGETWKEIDADGFSIDAQVEMLMASDSRRATAKAIGLGMIGFADALERLAPDILMLLGDRFEALAAASTALVLGIPIAHISGGDVTEGAFDDSLRHAITKMSHLHFVASQEAAARVVQMGEDPARVFAVGDPGLDSLRDMKLIDRHSLENDLNIKFLSRNLLITYHPVTLEIGSSTTQFSILLDALQSLGTDVGLIFTHPNADPEGRGLATMLEEFVSRHPNATAFKSLGRHRYLSVMNQCDVVIGNSSSGLVEAPSLNMPTVNIGTRQAGRLRSKTVIDCPVDVGAITCAIEKAFNRPTIEMVNPYGDGYASGRIVEQLKKIEYPKMLMRKTFHNFGTP